MKTKNESKLIWKKKWLDDKSGYWYSAKVPILNWEYVIDGEPCCVFDYKNQDYKDYEEFTIGVFLSKIDDDFIKISKKRFRKKETAMVACEKHLQDTANRFNKWMETNDVDLISDQELKNLVDKSKRSVKLSK